MTQRRSIRTTLLALALTAACFMAAAVVAGPAQAAATGSAQASAGTSASAGSESFARVAYDPATISTTDARAATVKRVGTTAPTAAAPLPGFCTLDGISGATSYITCSVVVPATVYVWCSSGAIFYGYLPAAGIYALTATPCFATGYTLV